MAQKTPKEWVKLNNGINASFAGLEIENIISSGGTSLPSQGGHSGEFLTTDGTNPSWATISGGGDALVANPLSQFAATTSLQLKGVISDETGSGALVFATSPTLVTPNIGAATATTINGATITSGTLNGSVTGTNTGDQTSIVGITGTKVQYNTSVTDGDFLFTGDVTDFYTTNGSLTSNRTVTGGAFDLSFTGLDTWSVSGSGNHTTTTTGTGNISANSAGYFEVIAASNIDLFAPVFTVTCPTVYIGAGSVDVVATSNVTTTSDMTISLTSKSGITMSDVTNAASGSLAGKLLDLTHTWNTSGNPTAIKLVVTDTAFGGTAALMDLQTISAGSVFRVLPTGSITNGIWNGTVISAIKGGTDQTSYAVGDLLQANTTTSLSKLAAVATGNVLISGGIGTVSSWGKVGLTTHVSGVLPVANGGTNASTASITSFNNITGYTASGATGTTSTNLVFSTSPTITSPTVATSLNGSYLTASEMLITDGSKNIVSAAVATYPSLTELTYVKGVTSAIQTQLNTKLSANQTITLSGDVTGSGTTAITTTIAAGAVDIAMLSATGTPDSTTYLRGDNTWATIAGGGTVTATGGSLTANSIVLGAGTTDTKVVAGIITDGTSMITLGVNATTIGKLKMFGNTSGDVTIQPTAAAGTATVQTLPATTGTLVNRVTTNAGVSASNSDGALTFTLGAITPTTVNGHTFTTGSSTFTGTAAQTYTFPTTTATIARTDAAQTFTGTQTFGTAALNSTGLTIASSFTLGNSSSQVNIGGSTGTINISTSQTSNGILLYSSSTNGTGIVNFGNATNYTNTSGVRNLYNFSAGWAPTSGTGELNAAAWTNVINQTGGASGTTRSIYVNPTLTAAANYFAIETANGPIKHTDTYASGSGSLAGSLFDLAQTWNTSGTPTAIKLNVTDTASNAASLLLDLKVGGTSKFAVNKGGAVTATKITVAGQYASTTFALTDGATIALDWNNGNIQSVTLGGNRTFTFANPLEGGRYVIKVKQDATGSRTVTWPTITWKNATAPTLSTVAGRYDLITLIYLDGVYVGDVSQPYA